MHYLSFYSRYHLLPMSNVCDSPIVVTYKLCTYEKHDRARSFKEKNYPRKKKLTISRTFKYASSCK